MVPIQYIRVRMNQIMQHKDVQNDKLWNTELPL